MKFRMPCEVQNINAMLVLLCAMLGLFMISLAYSSVVGAVLAVIIFDFAARNLIKSIKNI